MKYSESVVGLALFILALSLAFSGPEMYESHLHSKNLQQCILSHQGHSVTLLKTKAGETCLTVQEYQKQSSFWKGEK